MWKFGSQTNITTSQLISRTFTSVGNLNVQLEAWNNISSANISFTLTITGQMANLNFGLVNLGPNNSSTSIVGQNANFLFTIGSGFNYVIYIIKK